MMQKIYKIKGLMIIGLIILFSFTYFNLIKYDSIKINIKLKKYTANNNITIKNKVKNITLKNQQFFKLNKNIFRLNKNKLKKINNKINFKLLSFKIKKKLFLIKNKKDELEIKENVNPKQSTAIIGQITSNIKFNTTNNNIVLMNINDNKLLSINLNKNKIYWQMLTNPRLLNFSTYSKIIKSNDKIYYILPDDKIILIKKYSGDIIDKRRLRLKSHVLEKNNDAIGITSIKIYKNILYLCYSNGNFCAINGTNGKILWKKTKKNYENFLIKENKLIIIKKNNHITRLNIKNGKKIWTNKSLESKKIISTLITKKNNLQLLLDNKNVIHFINENGFIIKSIKFKKEKILKLIDDKKKIIALNNKGDLIKLKFKI